MALDRFIPFDDLINGDPRHGFYDDGITTDWIQSALAEMLESPRIPEPVYHQLSLARQLCIAGWFLWDLYAVALHYTTVACEAAIRYRFADTLTLPICLAKKGDGSRVLDIRPEPHQLVELLRNGWRLPDMPRDFRAGFRQLVDWGLRTGVIRTRDQVRWDAVIGLRNLHAHGGKSVLPPNIPLTILRRAVWMINALYPDANTETHDAPLVAAADAEAEAVDQLIREALPEWPEA